MAFFLKYGSFLCSASITSFSRARSGSGGVPTTTATGRGRSGSYESWRCSAKNGDMGSLFNF